MNNISKKLKREPSFRQRVLRRIDGTDVNNFLNPKLHLLPRPFRRHLQQPLHRHTRPRLHQLAKISYGGVHNHLQIRRARPVVEFEKRERTFTLFPTRLDPSAYSDPLAGEPEPAVWTGEDGPDRNPVGELGFGDLWFCGDDGVV